MPIQSVDQGLDAGLVDVPDVRCRLTGLLASEDCMRVNEPEGVNDDLSFDGLNGVDHDRDRTRREGLERLLGVDIDTRQPTAKSWVGVIPPHDRFRPSGLFQHFEHSRLENVIDRFDGDSRPGLGHREDIDDLNSVVVHKLAQHETHDLHRHPGSAVF